jgi:hypothetical protein
MNPEGFEPGGVRRAEGHILHLRAAAEREDGAAEQGGALGNGGEDKTDHEEKIEKIPSSQETTVLWFNNHSGWKTAGR